jgi:protease IV
MGSRRRRRRDPRAIRLRLNLSRPGAFPTPMKASRSLLGRLFGALWALIDAAFKLTVVLLVTVVAIAIWAALKGGGPARMEDNVALVVYPSGELVDSTDVDPAQRFVEELIGERPTQTPLRDLTDALEKGAEDPRITLAVLKLDELSGAGLGQLQELGAAVRAFRAKGKPVYAYGQFYDQGHYLVAANADHVGLDPMGIVYLDGLDVYQTYLREALDKLGVNVHVFRVGEYKSAVEPFERNNMSPEAREANREWLNDLWQVYGREVARARQLPETAVHDYSLGLPTGLARLEGDGAELARSAKLVDALETLQEFRARIAEKVGWESDSGTFRQVHHREYLGTLERERRLQPAAAERTIALVVIQGEIVDGDSEPGLAGADTMSRLLTAARENDEVAAVVLRVDSPGGSVFASEQIRREVRALQAEGKPVVVSMSNVAASGGYWVAMDADEIWAHDATITGSIGIFGLWPTIEKPLAKLGIHTDGLGTTPLAGALRPDRPLTPEAATVFQTQIERGYRLFVEGVAQARELPVEKVRDIARGRVWSGADALALGLVDQIGGLQQAVAAAVRLAGLEAETHRLQEFKDEREFPLQKMLDILGTSVRAGLLPGVRIPEALKPVQRAAEGLRWLDDPRGVYAHCFCRPSMGGLR